MKELNAEDGFKEGARQFDGRFVEEGRKVWYEAKSGNAWENMLANPKSMSKFKGNAGDQKRIAKENGAEFRVYSDVPIPESISKWMDSKEIPWEVR